MNQNEAISSIASHHCGTCGNAAAPDTGACVLSVDDWRHCINTAGRPFWEPRQEKLCGNCDRRVSGICPLTVDEQRDCVDDNMKYWISVRHGGKAVAECTEKPENFFEQKIKQWENEAVNHPRHYAAHPIEVINIIRDQLLACYGMDGFRAYCWGNEIKYRMRAGLKGDAAEDIGKAMKYKEFREALDEN